MFDFPSRLPHPSTSYTKGEWCCMVNNQEWGTGILTYNFTKEQAEENAEVCGGWVIPNTEHSSAVAQALILPRLG